MRLNAIVSVPQSDKLPHNYSYRHSVLGINHSRNSALELQITYTTVQLNNNVEQASNPYQWTWLQKEILYVLVLFWRRAFRSSMIRCTTLLRDNQRTLVYGRSELNTPLLFSRAALWICANSQPWTWWSWR